MVFAFPVNAPPEVASELAMQLNINIIRKLDWEISLYLHPSRGLHQPPTRHQFEAEGCKQSANHAALMGCMCSTDLWVLNSVCIVFFQIDRQLTLVRCLCCFIHIRPIQLLSYQFIFHAEENKNKNSHCQVNSYFLKHNYPLILIYYSPV